MKLLKIGSQMQEVWGSNPRLGGLRLDQLQAFGDISTLQSRASGLQSTAQGNSIRTNSTPPCKQAKTVGRSPQIPNAWSTHAGLFQRGQLQSDRTPCFYVLARLRACSLVASRYSSVSLVSSKCSHRSAQLNPLLYSGKISERHAEGTRPPRRQTYISVILGLLSQSRS